MSNITIVGYSLRAPNCSSVPEFARALEKGEDLTTASTRYPSGHLGLPPRQGRLKEEDEASFDAAFFGLSHKQADAMDPLIRMLLQVSYEALLDAQIPVQDIRGSKTGVYVGHCFSDVSSHSTSSFNSKKSGYELVNGANAMAANRLSYFYDFKGPSVVIDTACSSSLVALHYAVQDLVNGTIDRALVGGLSLTLNPHKNSSFNAFTMLSPTGHCHTFDKRADGYCRSDGVACIVLERDAVDGYAIIAGTGSNSDGNKNEGITYPSASQQARLMLDVFSSSTSVRPSEVEFHEAHGTGTIAGDKEELAALAEVYTDPLTIGSVKSNMGHAEGASGLMGLIKILLMYEDKKMYPNHDFRESPHSMIRNGRFTVLQESMPWQPAGCSISSFGFGGSNAFCILKPFKSSRTSATELDENCPVRSLPFASCDQALAPTTAHEKYYAIQRSLGNDRQFRYVWHGGEWKEYSPIVFVCDGQGSQWNSMGQDLMKTSGVFRSKIQCLEEKTGIPLTSLYEDGTQWMTKVNSTIGIVSFQLGLLAILRDAGVHPDLFLGHSVGELACSFLAGCATEEEVLGFAAVRTKLVVSQISSSSRLDVFDCPPRGGHDYEMETMDGGGREIKSDISATDPSFPGRLFVKRTPVDAPPNPDAIWSFSMNGLMIVVGDSAERISGAITDLGLLQTRIACFNAPNGQTVSGPASEVQKLIDYLKEKDENIFIRKLPTDSIAYHGIYLKVFKQWLTNEFGEVTTKPLPSSWKSTCRQTVFSSQYLVENICQPVYFNEVIDSLPKNSTVVEIGPASGMLSQIKRTRKDLGRIGLIVRGEPAVLDDPLKTLQTLGELRAAGSEVTLSAGRPHFTERYPNLFDPRVNFRVPSWEEFELPHATETPKIVYDLSRQPWSSLRHHIMRGQNLFPASGYIHALWSTASYARDVEIVDFRIHTALVIAPFADAVTLRLYKAGTTCELWDEDGKIRHASARVQPAASTASLSNVPSQEQAAIFVEGQNFYPDRKRLGYEYGASYQILGSVSPLVAHFKVPAADWIAYMDAMLHLRIFDLTTFGYPIGFDRVLFRENDLSKAPLWVSRPQENTLRNTAVLLEGLRMEYLPVVPKAPSIHNESFVSYSESDAPLCPSIVAALLARESRQYCVQEPLLSTELQAVVEELQKGKIAEQAETAPVLISDTFPGSTKVENLLVTTFAGKPPSPHVLVARWAAVCLYRIGEPAYELPVVTNWKDAARMSGPFVWSGDGASGAVSTLCVESGGFSSAVSYEGPCEDVVGVEKRMRINYVLQDGTHGVWVDSAVVQKTSETEMSSKAAVLEVAQPGNLQSLEWCAIDVNNFSVETTVAALNFRDIMRAMGRLKEEDLSLGLEFSGVEIETKRRIFGVAKHSLGTHISPMYSFPTPPRLKDDEAATIPVVYLTVYYALFQKANMRRGESVLIHAGTGGVGMAAITVAQKRGLKVFTTCSAPKKEYLKERFKLKDWQIGDSRSDSFIDTVMAGTQGRGVDVVLNQLAGDLQVASLRCLASGGRFCEIGKYDILKNTGLGQALLASNVSFHVIDLLPLLSDPTNKPLWDKWLQEGFDSNEIVPLPAKTFSAAEIIDAFRFMSQSKHTGKLLITGFQSTEFPVRNPSRSLKNETHLISGGLGGLGLSLATKLVENGCKDVILVGRRGVTNGFQHWKISLMEATGCKVRVVKSDLLNLKKDFEPNRIWHVATVYKDLLLSEMTQEAWDLVMRTKVEGYHHMRSCWPSAYIVNISSVVAYFGNVQQTSYAMANAALDAAARRDKKTLSIRLGPLDNVGFITKGDNNRTLFERFPYELMRVDDVLEGLMKITSRNSSGVFGIYDVKANAGGREASVGNALQGDISQFQSEYTLERAQKFISLVLGGSPDQYKPKISLKQSGLDSLSTMEVVHHIQKEGGNPSFKSSDIDDDFSIQTMIDAINQDRSSRRGVGKDNNVEKSDVRSSGVNVNAEATAESKAVLVTQKETRADEVSGVTEKKTVQNILISPFEITESDDTCQVKKHRSFSLPNTSAAHQQRRLQYPVQAGPGESFGIVAMEVYTPAYAVSADTLQGNGIPARSKQGQDAVAVWDAQEDSVSMAMTALEMLINKHVDDPYNIGRLEVSTESKDMAKSIKYYLMQLLPQDHVDVEGIDNMNSCYGGTAALLNTMSWCRETGRYGIVVATDTSDMDLPESGWRGASAVALLIGPEPWIEIHRERASCFKNTRDFLKPRHGEAHTPLMQTKSSTDHYINSLAYTIKKIQQDHSVDVASLDAFVFHGGSCASFMKLVERHLIERIKPKAQWETHFDFARRAASDMGGLYTASLYVNLASLVAHTDPKSVNRIALFSYGSGSTASLLQATIHHHRGHGIDLLERLKSRSMVSFETLQKIVDHEDCEVLARKPGVFYRDLCRDDSVEPLYFRESGDGERFSPKTAPTRAAKLTRRRSSRPSLSLRRLSSSAMALYHNVFDDEQGENPKHRFWLSLLLLVITTYWIVAVSVSSKHAGEIFGYASLVFLVCALVHAFIYWAVKRKRFRIRGSVTTLSHYLLGVASFLAYVILYAVGYTVFLKRWGSIFFGYYVSDNVAIVTFWEDIHPSFRFFYAIHHSIGLLLTATWIIVNESWEKNIVLGVMLWLTAEIWQYAFMFWRHFPSNRLSVSSVDKAKWVCFWLERAQRIAAYFGVLILESFDLSSVGWFILASGLFIDAFDITFQLKALLGTNIGRAPCLPFTRFCCSNDDDETSRP